LINTGNTIHIDDVGTWVLTGQIKGGTIASNSSAAALILVGEDPGLDGVTIAGNLKTISNVPTSPFVSNGLHFAGGSLTLNTFVSSYFTNSQALTGTGDFFLNGASIVPLATLTIGSGVAIRNLNTSGRIMPGSGTGGVINEGLISAEVPRGRIDISISLANRGTIQVTAGMLSVAANSVFPSFSGGSLNTGAWIVGSNSTLILGTASITTNDATVILKGVGSTFIAINPLRRNRGFFSISDGRDFSSVGSLTNTGTINICSLSTLSVLDTIVNASGLIDLNHKLIVDYSGASPLSELVGQIGTHIISSAAIADPTLGIGSKDDGNVVLLQLATVGDANLDEFVNFEDLTALSQNYESSPLLGPGWTGGDFNYDGAVNLTDLYSLGYQYQDPLNPLPQALQTLGLPIIEVPEPGMTILFLGAWWCCRGAGIRRLHVRSNITSPGSSPDS